METKEPFDLLKVQNIVRDLLLAVGEDPDREGLKETPRRVAKYWNEFVNFDPGKIETAFESVSSGQMIVVSGMRVWSMCEHHLLPFWADVTVGYIADKKVLGLSKFARIAHKHAHRLQVQERLVDDIADEIVKLTGSKDVAVLASGVHTCMVARGIRTDGLMTSSAMRGAFESRLYRSEFYTLANIKL